MITFYPNKIPMWVGVFDFDDITLSVNVKSSQSFYNKEELIDFLKIHGVVLNDINNLLTITDHGGPHFSFGHGVSNVYQGSTLLGWVKDNYR